MLHACGNVSGGMLWANLHLLLWLVPDRRIEKVLAGDEA